MGQSGRTMSRVAESRLLDLAGIAAELGVKPGTVYGWRYRYKDREPRFPAPDLVFLGREAWLPETIRAWRARMPGQGAGGGRKPRG
jgi:hypothetical protein